MFYRKIRISLLAGFLSVFVFPSSAQTSFSNEQLYTFIKVWGFLKYYHPALASGQINADSLFTSRVQGISTLSDAGFKKNLTSLLKDLGPTGQPVQTDSVTLFTRNQDFQWIGKLKLVPPAIGKELRRMSVAGYPGDTHQFMPATFYETQLPGENPHAGIVYPDLPFQLLALARYWNAIEYLYPYKYMLPVPWDKVLRQHIPAFSKPMTATDFEIQLLKLNAAIEDSHGGIVNIKNKGAVYGSFFPPFFFRFAGDSLVVTDYIDTLSCTRQDIHPGDVIYSIADSPVSLKDKDWYVSASNLNKKKAIMSSPILMLPLRSKDSLVTIGLIRAGRRKQMVLKLEKPTARYVAALTEIYKRETGNGTTTTNGFVLKTVDPGIAMIDAANLSIFYNSTSGEKGIDSIMLLMRQHGKAIILDLRCYATQAVFYNKFLSALGWQLRPFVSLKAHSTAHPGAYYERDLFSTVKQKDIKDKYNGKVILLVDSRTHSQSEMITMVMQASGPAMVVGTQSSGADGDVIDLPIPGGYEVSFSGRHVSYPDGSPSQMTGVKRDMKVKVTTAGIAAGRDEILEAALKLVR